MHPSSCNIHTARNARDSKTMKYTAEVPPTRGDAQSPESPNRTNAHYVPWLLSRYVAQLLHGCQDSRCSEALCYTGRLNTSSRPLRRYTPRSTRIVAIGVVSGPRPRAHLCPYYCMPTSSAPVASFHDSSIRDPSSIPQLLCDTEHIKRLTDPTAAVSLKPDLLELQQRYQQLNDLTKQCSCLAGSPPQPVITDDYIAETLLQHILWLLSQVPLQRLASWSLVNHEFVSKGQAYPQRLENIPADECCNTWLSILDALSHEPHLRLLAQVARVAACRCAVHYKLLGKNLTTGSNVAAGFVHSKGACTISTTIVKRLNALDAGEGLHILPFITWLKRLFVKHWNSKPVITYGSICHGALDLLESLDEYVDTRAQATLGTEVVQIPFIASTISMVDMSQSFMDWTTHGDRSREQHLLRWSWLFTQEQLVRYFRTTNHLTMRAAHSDVEVNVGLWRRSEALVPSINQPAGSQFHYLREHYLLLNVSRDNVLKDVFDQLWQRRKAELRRPLRVRLGEIDELEIGHDLGGVQIEFFNLVCREIFAKQAQMFNTDVTTGYSYFRAGSLQPLHMFEMFGLLVAIALYNGIVLPINMPLVFYKLLAEMPLGTSLPRLDLAELIDAWPSEARSLERLTAEYVPGVEYVFPFEANGVRLAVAPISNLTPDARTILEVESATDKVNGREIDVSSIGESWPGWDIVSCTNEAMEITSQNSKAYVMDYVQHLTFKSVKPQWAAFYKGFHDSNVIGYEALVSLAPEVLKQIVEGTSHLDLDELKAATRYDDYDPKSKYIHWFWKIVYSWSEAKQKDLLKFVTAAERIPISGAHNLTFIIKKSTPDNPESLPTSSTCFGTLMLPRYSNADVLAAKLDLALKYGTEGFGTG